MRWSVWVALMFAGVALAGCTDDTTTNDGTSGEPDDGVVSDPDVLTAESVVEAPEWAVGDYFGHHIFFGSEDAQGTHIDAVVVDASGGDYTLVSDQKEAAKWEAAWDFPMLGTIGAKDLETTAFSADWKIYDFPLSDGKTWTATFNPLFSGARELTLTATFNDAIPTIGQGKKAGFQITGVNADGDVELVTDYIPEIGWYSELTYFDPLTEDPEDFIIRVWGMGQGSDWEGTVITAVADQVVDNQGSCFAPLNADGTVNDQCTQAFSSALFQVDETIDELYGLVFLLAIAGVSSADLVDPTPFDHRHEARSSSMDEVYQVFDFYEIEDPAVGQWNYQWSGAGVVSVGYTQMWTMEYTATEFPAANA